MDLIYGDTTVWSSVDAPGSGVAEVPAMGSWALVVMLLSVLAVGTAVCRKDVVRTF